MTLTVPLPAYVLPTILGHLRARRELETAALERMEREALWRWSPALDDAIRNIRLETLDLNEAIAAVEVACAGARPRPTEEHPL